MEASLTAADIHRWFAGPWCPKCGTFPPISGVYGDDCPYCQHKPLKPGLYTRWPETKPEGLEYDFCSQIIEHTPQQRWMIHGGAVIISPDRAADLCLAGVVKASPNCSYATQTRTHRGLASFRVGPCWAQAPTIHEAAAIAAHRYQDALEGS